MVLAQKRRKQDTADLYTKVQDCFPNLLHDDAAVAVTGEKEMSDTAWEEPFASKIDRLIAHVPMKVTYSSREVCIWFKVNMALYPRIQLKVKEYMAETATSVSS